MSASYFAKGVAKTLGIAMAVCFSVACSFGFMAWLTVLPTIGLLWSIGWLK